MKMISKRKFFVSTFLLATLSLMASKGIAQGASDKISNKLVTFIANGDLLPRENNEIIKVKLYSQDGLFSGYTMTVSMPDPAKRNESLLTIKNSKGNTVYTARDDDDQNYYAPKLNDMQLVDVDGEFHMIFSAIHNLYNIRSEPGTPFHSMDTLLGKCDYIAASDANGPIIENGFPKLVSCRYCHYTFAKSLK